MPQVKLYAQDGQEVGSVALADQAFGIRPKPHLIHEVVVAQLSNKRRGTASTKTRGEVEGGSQKPWRQKRTGRARAGTSRSPLWRGGGVVFGPSPHTYGKRPPKKVRRAALASALSARLAEGRLRVIEDFTLERPHTKSFVAFLAQQGIDEGRVLLVLGEPNSNVYLSARNVARVAVVRELDTTAGEQTETDGAGGATNGLTVYHLAANDWVVIFRSAVASIERRISGGSQS